jgi:hypothetical protein
MNNLDRVEEIKSRFPIQSHNNSYEEITWDEFSYRLAKVKDILPFCLVAEAAGFRSRLYVSAWYDLYHGSGAFNEAVRVEEEYRKSTQGVKGED